MADAERESVSGEAVIAQRRGDPTVLTLVNREVLPPGPGQIRIVVEAAGVAYGDLLLREGLIPKTAFPVVPGYDVVGVVDAVGDGVDEFAVGDRVVAVTGERGGYATHVTLSADLSVPCPPGLDAAEVTALALNYVTAHQMLTRAMSLGAGSTVLVHGAAGGVGSALSELATLSGHRVLGTASGNRLNALAEGGVEPIDRLGDWQSATKKLAPAGVDAVFDGVGGKTSAQSLGLLGPGGHLVSYGLSSALRNGRRYVPGLIRAALQSPRRSSLTLFSGGVSMDSYASNTFIAAHRDWFRADLSALVDLLAAGSIRPVIADRLPLARASEAHQRLARGVTGKLVLISAEHR